MSDAIGCLARDRVRNVFALHVLASGRARVVEAAGGVGVYGPVLAVPSAWVVAEEPDAARQIVAAFAGVPVQIGSEWADLLRETRADVSLDVYLAREAGGSGEASEVTAELLARVEVPEDVRRAIGRIEELPPASLWGRVHEGRLVAICDTIVRWGDVVSVQQVWTTPAARRQGHARALIAGVLAHPELRGCTASWLAEAGNTASIALAESLGFAPAGDFAYSAG